jgi:hypothetical protein
MATENETKTNPDEGQPVTTEVPAAEVPSDENFLVTEHLQKMPSIFARGLFYLILLFLAVALVYSIKGKVDIVVVCPAVARLDTERVKGEIYMDIVAANKDVGMIEPGMSVRYRFHAFPHSEFGTLWGIVLGVSDYAVEEKSQEFVFHVRGSLAKPSFEINGRSFPIKPGMTGVADLVIARKSIFSVLVGVRK